MFNKTAAAAVLAATALLGATPALADGFGKGYPQKRVVVVQKQVSYYGHRRGYEHRRGYQHRHGYERRPVVVHRHVRRPVVAHRPVIVHRPVVVRHHSSHDVLGGLIVGAVLGAVIAGHAGY